MSLGLPKDFGFHPGWEGGMFTRQQVPGAIPNGTTVKKVAGDEGDLIEIGGLGVVVGSITTGKLEDLPGMTHPVLICYFVEWARKPRHALATVDWKIAPAASPRN